MLENQIQQLPEEVINQIAAGEVVERPAHLVKELVENSLDAEATQISIEFSEGGRSIRVTDNGKGIHAKDLSKALDRHATSKIRNTEDLWKLRSFGFRGEALASISAVSDLTLISRTEQDSRAHRLMATFGKTFEIEEMSAAQGTQVQIEKLFENVPARLKFLKSAAAESAKIKMTLKALALANPRVEFRVTQDQKLVFFWPSASEKERCEAICEVKLYEARGEYQDVQVRAFFADPNTTQKTSKDIWTFAQNRWVQDRGIQAAILEAYRNLLMHGEYPMCVVFVQVPEDQIDVNIHPTKSQVKFLQSSDVFRAVQRGLRSGLEKAPWIPPGNEILYSLQTATSNPSESRDGVRTAVQEFSQKQLDLSDVQHLPTLGKTNSSQSRTPFFHTSTQFAVKSMAPAAPVNANVRSPSPAAPLAQAPSHLGYWSSLQVIGQVNLTYIVTQGRDSMVLVDQHAAHERIMFEKLMKAWRERNIEAQEFLFPLAIDLSAEKVEALLREQESFARFGVKLEALGPETVGVTSAPSFIKETALQSVIEKTATEILEQGGSFAFEKKLGDLFSTFACHSAIRAGQALSFEEMKALLQQMDEFPLSSFCPHGRPVNVTQAFSDLEKSFGRIV